MRFALTVIAALTMLILAGCVSPPIQAMSNARQAVNAAETAGAARYAPGDLAVARHWLDDAEFALDGGDYSHARASAERAGNAARAAADKARSAKAAASTSAVAPASGGEPLRLRMPRGR